MSYALALLLAKLVADGIGLMGSAAPLAALFSRDAWESGCLWFTAAAMLRRAGAALPAPWARAWLVLLTLAACAFSVADAAALHYLQQDIVHAAGNLLSLRVGARDAAFYATQYVGWPLFAGAIAVHGAIAALFWRRLAPPGREGWALAALVALQLAGLNRRALAGREGPTVSRSYVYTFRPLAAMVHRPAVPRWHALALPRTAVLFINESLPRRAPDSKGTSGKLMAGIVARAPAGGTWIEFPRARTNSSVTEISVPSLLTGVDPTEGAEKLRTMPFVFDLARAAGYRTAFFTSQDYTWSNFHDFYRPARIDTYVTGDRSGLPKVNDSGIDDMEIADRVAGFIRGLRPDDRVLLVVNTNAWHLPLQTRSRIPVPDLPGSERKAAYILEQYYREVLGALVETGRLPGSLIFVTSDHGEFDPRRPRAVDRLRNHFEEVANVPYYLHLPEGTPAEIVRRARGNAAINVANVDLAPTLADCLGFGPPPDLAYTGYSLLEPMPNDRFDISVTTSEWKQWNSSAFGLARGDQRFIFIENRGGLFFDLKSDPAEEHGISRGEDYELFLQKAASIPTLEEMLLRTDIRGGGP